MRRIRNPRVSVVIPARNEARNLELVLPEMSREHEIVLVDGYSSDDTVAITRRLAPDARIVQQTRRGKGNALACGFAASTGDVIVMLDADGSADPAEIDRFVAALVGGADFAKGSRFCQSGGSEDITRLRALGNHGLSGVANRLFSTRFSDLCYGYNAFWRDILPVLNLPPLEPVDRRTMLWGDGFEIETVINCRVAAAGLSIVEVPSVERLRVHGETNLRTFGDGGRVLRTIWAEYRTRDLRRRLPVPVVAPERQPAPVLESA